ncbi:RmlC-like cupin domain-containing protein [Pyrenochaeta sp. MPI-SDFR-AT-0127]|nr:RmlC-like cupin domain-containing protein [Pyrenochaeta sp. MPI-SDFR-AT-0127]
MDDAHLSLNLIPHIEGGYFAELDRNPLLIPNPFPTHALCTTRTAPTPLSGSNDVRNASTSIYYLLTPASPLGCLHRNLGRTVHTLIQGRGRYVIIHADEQREGPSKRVESFVVGLDADKGERSVWVVEGGKYKASFLLPWDGEERLLISETVVPGFEYADHDFLTMEGFAELVSEEQRGELEWLIRKA